MDENGRRGLRLSERGENEVGCPAGADGSVLNSDRLAELAADGVPERGPAAERAAETVRDVWRSFEFNVQAGLALEALFVRLRRELGGAPTT